MLKILVTIVLLLIAGASLHYSMFWGWASGAGNPPNAEEMKRASNIALAISGLALAVSISLWIVPRFRRKRMNHFANNSVNE